MTPRKRQRAMPGMEALETRTVLSATGPNQPPLIAPGGASHMSETLAAQALPATYWISTRGEAIDRPGGRVTVDLPLTADRVDSARANATLFEIRITPTEGSTFAPRSFRLIGPDGRHVPDVANFRDGAVIGGLARLAPGDYAVRVRGRGDSTGSFLVQVHLVGDVDGDRRVDRDDQDAIRAAQGPDRVGGATSTSAPPHLDINRDGRVGPRDVALTRLNRGAESTTIQYLIRNATGGIADKSIHVAFYGRDANDAFIFYDEGGRQHSLQGDYDLNPLIPGSTDRRYVYNFTLDKAPNGIEIPRADVIRSAPILIGLNADVIAPIDLMDGQVSGVAPPSSNNPSDPNNDRIYQLAEVTQNFPADVPPFVNLDTSVVEQFGLPLTLQLDPRDIKVPDGAGAYQSRSDVVQRFLDGASGDRAAFRLSVTRAGTAPDPLGTGDRVPLRILAPQDVLFLDPPADPGDRALYDALNRHFDGAIDELFRKYQAETLSLYSGANSSVLYQGTVKTVEQQDIDGNTRSYYVLQFTGGPSEAYNVYYPYFATNTPADLAAGTLYESTPPPPPSWWAKDQPAGSLDQAASASKMVFACNGVFADDAFQPASTYSGSRPVLADLENQLASALNRGVATTMVVQSGSIADNPRTPTDGLYTTTARVEDNTKLRVGMNVKGPGTNGLLVIRSIDPTSTTEITLSSLTPIYPVNPQPLTFATYYAPGRSWNYYAAFFHDPAVSIDGLAYGFPYDDQGGTSTDISVESPAQVTITIGWRTALVP